MHTYTYTPLHLLRAAPPPPPSPPFLTHQESLRLLLSSMAAPLLRKMQLGTNMERSLPGYLCGGQEEGGRGQGPYQVIRGGQLVQTRGQLEDANIGNIWATCPSVHHTQLSL
jgi:hypothetical protein